MNVQAAKKAKEFVFIAPQGRPDSQGRHAKFKVLVPGHEGRQYQVLLRRVNGGFSAECSLLTGIGTIPCPSRQGTSLCYHALAAIMAVGAQNEVQVIFPTSGSAVDAKRLTHLWPDAKLFTLYRWDNARVQAWGIARKAA